MVAVKVKRVILAWFGEGMCGVISVQVQIAAGVSFFVFFCCCCLVWFCEGFFLCVCDFWLIFVFWFLFFPIKYIPCNYAFILRDEKQKK